MRLRFCFSLAALPVAAAGQTFPLTPYVNGVTSIKNGFIEAGPQYKFSTTPTLSQVVRLTTRLPLSDKETNTATIDRSLQSWRGVLAYTYEKEHVPYTGPVSWYGIGLQAEFGRNQFKYYPTGQASNEAKRTGNSYAGEVKFYTFASQARAGASQHSWQARLRYGSESKGADEVGVIGPAGAAGLVTTTNMVVEAPARKTTFAPALAYQYYSGATQFSYTPALYFDRVGGADEDNPFAGGSGRYRAEFWIFYYPASVIDVKIGLAPYLSVRAVGTDKLNPVEFGGQLSFRTGANFMNFFQ